ncbi:aspartyl-phosphate phosphatase Spo0E family protein [Paenibacillus lautus]|uniref:Spo0E family sporulation regulatory protein-aspartic acid phosphatase n=1 Tax=Paenibacillus lautus TaxID=1401 RepID=UPI003D2D1260
MNELQDLITKFELLRQELNLIDQEDLTSQEVIEKSQELDNLHNQIEAYKIRHSKIASCSTDN